MTFVSIVWSFPFVGLTTFTIWAQACQEPATVRVAALRRFQTLITPMLSNRAASSVSS